MYLIPYWKDEEQEVYGNVPLKRVLWWTVLLVECLNVCGSLLPQGSLQSVFKKLLIQVIFCPVLATYFLTTKNVVIIGEPAHFADYHFRIELYILSMLIRSF